MTATPHIPALPDPGRDFWAEAEALGQALRNQLEYFEALGVTELPRSLLPPLPSPAPAPRPSPPGARGRPARADGAEGPEGGGRPRQAPRAIMSPAAENLPAWRLQLAACQACALARGGGEGPVPGRGSETPVLAVVGPDPSIHGGPPGELLVNMLEKGLRLTPGEYYLTTLIKCRPPEGTEPSPEAVAACQAMLQQELRLLKPPVILALGELTGRRLSGRLTDPLGLLRPRSHRLKGLPGTWLRVTYDLEHLVNSVALKKEAWKDLQKIRLGLDTLQPPPAADSPSAGSSRT